VTYEGFSLKGYISFPVLSAQERKISRPGIKPGIKPGRTQRRKGKGETIYKGMY